MEKVLQEFRIIETEDGFRIEIKGDKEQLRDFVMSLDPRRWMGSERGPGRFGAGFPFGPRGFRMKFGRGFPFGFDFDWDDDEDDDGPRHKRKGHGPRRHGHGHGHAHDDEGDVV